MTAALPPERFGECLRRAARALRQEAYAMSLEHAARPTLLAGAATVDGIAAALEANPMLALAVRHAEILAERENATEHGDGVNQ